MKKERYQKEQALRGDLDLMNDEEIKPDFTQLAEKYGMNRHTVAKYWKEGEYHERKKRSSPFDQYVPLMNKKLEEVPCTKAAMFHWLQKKDPETFKSYSAFAHYTRRNGIEFKQSNDGQAAHLRYETDYGKQLQADWKEDLKIVLKSGEIIEFNLFTATFSSSRKHYFVFSIGKGTYDFIRCILMVLKKAGGKPEEILTDNMSAITNQKTGRLLPEIAQFGKDLGVNIKRCRIRTPQTKGKDESANRFAQWLVPYNNELDSVDQLLTVINELEKDVNKRPNETTGLPPDVLFKKEMEHLKPLPSNVLMSSYIQNIETKKVPQTLLVTYGGAQYSVPMKYIGKNIRIVPTANYLYLYHNTALIAVHKKQPRGSINYDRGHYAEGLQSRMKKDIDRDDLMKMVDKNMKLLDRIGDKNDDSNSRK